MVDINSVVLSGFLGHDPRTGNTQKGALWCNGSVGLSTRRFDGTFETHWVRFVAWDAPAAQIAACRKGDVVVITGRIQTSTYEKDGQKRTSTEVVVVGAAKVVVPATDGEQYLGTTQTGEVP